MNTTDFVCELDGKKLDCTVFSNEKEIHDYVVVIRTEEGDQAEFRLILVGLDPLPTGKHNLLYSINRIVFGRPDLAGKQFLTVTDISRIPAAQCFEKGCKRVIDWLS